MNIWLWVLSFSMGFILGFFTAALCCAAGRSDEENERLRMHILKNYPGGKGEN